MQNNISNISFKSNIRFVPYKTYNKLASKCSVGVSEMNNLDQVCEIKKNGTTSGIIYCVGGVIKVLDEKKDYIFHWFPRELYSESGVGRKLKALIEIGNKLQEISGTGNTKGLLIGGLSKKFDGWADNRSLLSLRLFNFLKKNFDKKNRKNFTMFFGQNLSYSSSHYPMSAFVYCKKKDTYYINSRIFLKYPADGFKELLDKNEIRECFDWINIADEDKVFIGLKSKEQIPNDFWKKSKFEKSKNY